MEPSRQTFDAGLHRNIVIPNCIFADNTKEYHVLVDSPLGKAAVRLSFGSPMNITDDEESEDEDKSDKVSSVNTNDLTHSIQSPAKKPKNSFWPDYIDLNKGGRKLSYLCDEKLSNQMNKGIIRRLMLWARFVKCITNDVRKKHPFGEESCKEQLAMLSSIGDICNCIAASSLPVSLMGAKQLMNHVRDIKSVQEAELVENMAEFELFELTAHMSPCHTTFFVVTTHKKPRPRKSRKHVIYGIFPRFQASVPCPIEQMYLENSKGFDGYAHVLR